MSLNFASGVAIAILFISQGAQAQGHGSTGGGGPSGRTDATLIRCTDLSDQAAALETKWVKMHVKGTQGKSQTFLKTLDQVAASVLFSQAPISKVRSCDLQKPTQAEVELLKKIEEIWKLGIAEPDHCMKLFSQRSWRLKELEFLIDAYGKLCEK